MKLYYYPDLNSYIVGGNGDYVSLVEDSSAFAYCESLRYNLPTVQERDIEGDFCVFIKASSKICKMIYDFISLEIQIRARMASNSFQ